MKGTNTHVTARQRWQNVVASDMLLTNPKKVETGVDLIALANLIVYELPTRLFTLAQFVRPVWRPCSRLAGALGGEPTP